MMKRMHPFGYQLHSLGKSLSRGLTVRHGDHKIGTDCSMLLIILPLVSLMIDQVSIVCSGVRCNMPGISIELAASPEHLVFLYTSRTDTFDISSRITYMCAVAKKISTCTNTVYQALSLRPSLRNSSKRAWGRG